MDGFKAIFDECTERFGAMEADDSADVTIHLRTGEVIEANAVGIDFEDNICRHFTWEELDEDSIRTAIEDEPTTYDEVMSADVELGEPFMMMNGMFPWDNVANVEIDTKGLFG